MNEAEGIELKIRVLPERRCETPAGTRRIVELGQRAEDEGLLPDWLVNQGRATPVFVLGQAPTRAVG